MKYRALLIILMHCNFSYTMDGLLSDDTLQVHMDDHARERQTLFEITMTERFIFEPLVKGVPDDEKLFFKAAFLHSQPAFDTQVRRGIGINTKTGAGSALHFAMMGARLSYPFIFHVLNEKIDVNSTNMTGETPLHFLFYYLEHSYKPAQEEDFYRLFKTLLEKTAASINHGDMYKHATQKEALKRHPRAQEFYDRYFPQCEITQEK